MTPDKGGHVDRVVPVHAFTRGRTRAVGQDLPREAVATATGPSFTSGTSLQMESRAIVELCARPRSLAEIGAALKVPVGVARVLVGGLANGGYLEVAFPGTDVFGDRAVRDALALPEGCPLVRMGAREPSSCMARSLG